MRYYYYYCCYYYYAALNSIQNKRAFSPMNTSPPPSPAEAEAVPQPAEGDVELAGGRRGRGLPRGGGAEPGPERGPGPGEPAGPGGGGGRAAGPEPRAAGAERRGGASRTHRKWHHASSNHPLPPCQRAALQRALARAEEGRLHARRQLDRVSGEKRVLLQENQSLGGAGEDLRRELSRTGEENLQTQQRWGGRTSRPNRGGGGERRTSRLNRGGGENLNSIQFSLFV